ncbi:hypothetical protein [Halobiforma nitratireducens]|uniref:Uncharacterized protein n=1 Tax=Halobiforma nitratireducens JCM 10879 TaxID=1227454 RepID=M0LLN3_9EURY|nr:hypothetical protein C446_14104 [Halobiforma nitratireducens JCM 10879]
MKGPGILWMLQTAAGLSMAWPMFYIGLSNLGAGQLPRGLGFIALGAIALYLPTYFINRIGGPRAWVRRRLGRGSTEGNGDGEGDEDDEDDEDKMGQKPSTIGRMSRLVLGSESESESDSHADCSSRSDSDSDPNPDPHSESEHEPERESEPETEPESNLQPEVDTSLLERVRRRRDR